jgi:hypothetical protein
MIHTEARDRTFNSYQIYKIIDENIKSNLWPLTVSYKSLSKGCLIQSIGGDRDSDSPLKKEFTGIDNGTQDSLTQLRNDRIRQKKKNDEDLPSNPRRRPFVSYGSKDLIGPARPIYIFLFDCDACSRNQENTPHFVFDLVASAAVAPVS